MSNVSPLLGGAAAVFGATAYGINIPAARIAALEGVNGLGLAALRGGIFVLALFLIIRVTGRSLDVPSEQRRKILLMGLGAGVTGGAYLLSLTFIPVTVAVALFYTFPLILILIAPLTGSGRITPPRVLAFCIAFAGILFCVGPTLSGLDWRGVALALLASVSCAVMFEVTSRIKHERVALMFWSQAIALFVVVPGAFLFGLPAPSAVATVWIAVVVSSIGFYLGYLGQIVAGQSIRPATAGLLFLLEPVVAILTATIVLGESLRPIQIAGIGLVVAGLAIDSWTQGRRAPT